MAHVSGVILAAGQSSRLGRPKQLLPLGGWSLLVHVVRNAVASELDEVVLVLGHEAEQIAAQVGEWGQRVVVNPDYARGQSTSLKAGLGAIDPNADAVVFLLGDQPRVGPEIINALIAAYRESHGTVVIAEYGGQSANPVLFSREVFPDLTTVTGDQGARRIVRASGDSVVRVSVSDGSPPLDVDTEEDYQALLASWNEERPHQRGA